jgi:hypothetical protein
MEMIAYKADYVVSYFRAICGSARICSNHPASSVLNGHANWGAVPRDAGLSDTIEKF